MFFKNWGKKKKKKEEAEAPSLIVEQMNEAVAESVMAAMDEQESRREEEMLRNTLEVEEIDVAQINEDRDALKMDTESDEMSETQTDGIRIDETQTSETQADETEQDAPKTKKGLFARLKEGLSKTRDNIAQRVDTLFKGSEINDEFYEELEEILISADIGVHTTMEIVESLRAYVKKNKLKSAQDVRDALKQIIMDIMRQEDAVLQSPSIVLIVGVNGVGKTTTIGKLACMWREQGKDVLLAAADTFRAAASAQLTTWAERAGAPIIKHAEGADPAAVVFDAIQSAKSRHSDILLVDTAGRLHNKKHLMDELAKIGRICAREWPEARLTAWLVIDATTGQNGMNQAREFMQVVDLNGLILTKLDGTAKGGIAVAVRGETKLPVVYIGVGEQITDLQPFDAQAYVDAML